MPLQDYKCRECDHLVEDVFYHADKPVRWKKCPECGSRCHPTWKKAFNKKRTLKDVLGDAPWHPQIGPRDDIQTIDDFYRVCREMGMEEANDAVNGNRNWRQEELDEMKKQRSKKYALNDATPEQVDGAWGKEGLLT